MGLLDGVSNFVEANPLATAAGAVGLGVAAGLGTAAIIGSTNKGKSKRTKTRNSRKRGRRIKHTKRGWKQDRKRRSKQKWEVYYQKHKKKKRKTRSSSSRRVHYAKKTGQPYVLLASGKAKFIKGKRRKM